MTKHEQNSQNFANQNKTSSNKPAENLGAEGMAMAKNRSNTLKQPSGKNDRNDN